VLKQVLLSLFIVCLPVLLSAQQADSLSAAATDSNLVNKFDSSLEHNGDSILAHKADGILKAAELAKTLRLSYETAILSVIKENKFLNSSGTPFAMVTYPRKQILQDTVFYTVLTVVMLLAFVRFFYVRYFNNLFRVFFNSSLRQSQLTDQLLQAKLPSLFFNIISVVSGGLFIYLLLLYFGWVSDTMPLTLIGLCSFCVAVVYLLKFITLKFTGWVTGYKEITNTYIFVIFLINKILGILLLPFIVVAAFSVPVLIKVSVLAAILLTVLMFLLRFVRSYGLLQHQLKITMPHFFMYIIGIEILPVLLIYKGLVLLLSKNL
jgi:hypothetical protein